MRTKIVFDTNVFIAAAAPGAYSAEWLEAANDPRRSFDVYCSESILDEVKDVLVRKMRFSFEAATVCVEELKLCVTLVEPTEKVLVVDRDPADNKIIECAVAAGAELIISADRDLLQLRGFRGITVYHPNNLKYLFPQDFSKA